MKSHDERNGATLDRRKEQHLRVFQAIALPYSWFYSHQLGSYRRALASAGHELGPGAGKAALDLGCGTGAFSAALREAGWDASGIDAAPAMVDRAAALGQRCTVADILAGLPLPDRSFDLVAAAYVVHGLFPEHRLALYREARRLSRGLVLFHDYRGPGGLLTKLLERLEGGDYFGFIARGEAELREVFRSVRIVDVSPGAAWYLCEP